MEYGKTKNKNGIIYISAVLILATIFFWTWCYTSKSPLAEKLISSNVKTYVIGVGLFVLLIVCVSVLYSALNNKFSYRKEHKKQIALTRKGQIITCITLTLSGALLYSEWGLKSQFTEIGIAHSNAAYDYFPIEVRTMVTVALFVCIAFNIKKKYDCENVFLWVAYFLSVLISFLNVYVPNPFYDSAGGLVSTFPSQRLYIMLWISLHIHGLLLRYMGIMLCFFCYHLKS